MAGRYRQEVLNVALARALQERGLVAAPEYILDATLERGRRMVDVLVYYNGLRTAIEGEVGDHPEAAAMAVEAARRRVEEGVAHIGLAVVYPQHLREVDFQELPRELATCGLHVALVTEAGESEYATGDAAYLERALNAAFERLIREDVVTRAVGILDSAVGQFASALALRPGVIGRLMKLLGLASRREIRAEPPARRRSPEPHSVERGTCRIAGLVIVNAMIFQEVLSSSDPRVRSLSELPLEPDPVLPLVRHWCSILADIDYYPIFHIAQAALRTTTAHRETLSAVRGLTEAARELVAMRAPMRHDLMGRIYHRLLAQAKYLGTFYTSIPAATLLLELALRPEAWPVEWHDLEKLRAFRVVDLACGTGTLLMAAAQALNAAYIEASQGRGKGLDLPALHRVVIEDVLCGYDVLPSAVHLTASTLALRAPEVTFDRMNLYSLPLGGKGRRLGSIEFLGNKSVNMHVDLFGEASGGERVAPDGPQAPAPAPVPDIDLCVMNPPFTRSVGGNLLFGSSPPEERRQMQVKLGRMLNDPKVLANATAGLGAVFLAVAHSHVKPGGRLAVVLPRAVLSGIAWGPTRQLLRNYYRVEHIISSHDPERWNFSENTDLSEVLLIATKTNRPPGADHRAHQVTAVNLGATPTPPSRRSPSPRPSSAARRPTWRRARAPSNCASESASWARPSPSPGPP